MSTEFLPQRIDFERAHPSRIYDYLLGGAHNFAVDREHAARMLAVHPGMADLARANRAFLGRVVHWCARDGIDQFLDLGSGVPTVGNVHEIAARTHPEVRVAYVDHARVAVAHTEQILVDLDTVSVTRADLQDSHAVLAAPGVAGLLDFSRPVALLAIASLHFVSGEVGGFLDHYRSVLAPGSVLAISHISEDQDDPELADAMGRAASAFADSAAGVTSRTRDELAALLDGLDPMPPGLVDITRWPSPRPQEPVGFYGAAARVR